MNESRGSKRDVNTTAFRIMQEATGEKPKRRPPERDRAQKQPEKPAKGRTHPEG